MVRKVGAYTSMNRGKGRKKAFTITLVLQQEKLKRRLWGIF